VVFVDRGLIGVVELIFFVSVIGGFERHLRCANLGSVPTRGIIKTDFECMGRALSSQNVFLGSVYRFDKRILRGTFLRVLWLCTLFMTARGERRLR